MQHTCAATDLVARRYLKLFRYVPEGGAEDGSAGVSLGDSGDEGINVVHGAVEQLERVDNLNEGERS